MSELLAQSSTSDLVSELQTELSSSNEDLTGLWLEFLQTELVSSSSDIIQLENDWLASVVGSTGATIDLWNLYLKDRGYFNKSIPDAIFQAILDGSRTNLLTFSEQFDNAAWSHNGCVVTANNTTSPDGQITADSLLENTTSATRHGTFFTLGTLTSGVYSGSVFVKTLAGTRRCRLTLNTITATDFAYLDFNFQTGQIVQVANAGTVTGASGAVESFGQGWYRLKLSATLIPKYISIISITGDAIPAGIDFGYEAYIGDDSSKRGVWGAHLEQSSSPSSYLPTTTTSRTVTLFSEV